MTNLNNLSIAQVNPNTIKIEPDKKDKHFALGLNLCKLIWLFTLGSVIGFILETLWCLFSRGQWEVRSSLIFGPFNIIYGVGAVVLFLALRKINKKNKTQLFFLGIAVGTIVEYILSWAQEVIFDTVSWDYSNVPLNINGRVCLTYSLAWGALALLWNYAIYPLFKKNMLKIPNYTGKRITIILFIYMVLNAAVSSVAVMNWQKRTIGIPPTTQMEHFFEDAFPDEFMEIIYSNMRR